jgi:hypothetical protein
LSRNQCRWLARLARGKGETLSTVCVATMFVSPPIQPGPSLMLAVFPARASTPLQPQPPRGAKTRRTSKNDASVEPVFAFALQTQPRHKVHLPLPNTRRVASSRCLWLNRINWPIGPWNWVLTDAVRALLSLLLDPGDFRDQRHGRATGTRSAQSNQRGALTSAELNMCR